MYHLESSWNFCHLLYVNVQRLSAGVLVYLLYNPRCGISVVQMIQENWYSQWQRPYRDKNKTNIWELILWESCLVLHESWFYNCLLVEDWVIKGRWGIVELTEMADQWCVGRSRCNHKRRLNFLFAGPTEPRTVFGPYGRLTMLPVALLF